MSLLAFICSTACRRLVFVEMVLLDVVDDGDGDQVAHAHFSTQEETDLGAADVVLDQLLDNVDVVFPRLQSCKRFVDIGSTAFHDEGLFGC